VIHAGISDECLKIENVFRPDFEFPRECPFGRGGHGDSHSASASVPDTAPRCLPTPCCSILGQIAAPHSFPVDLQALAKRGLACDAVHQYLYTEQRKQAPGSGEATKSDSLAQATEAALRRPS